MKREKKEIRDILLGKTVLDEDGALTTLEPGMFRVPQGIMDGAGGVFFLGIARRARCYSSTYSEKDTLALAVSCMLDLGRLVRLRLQPETAACRIRYVLTRPAVLTFRYVDGLPVLTAWTGRGLMAWLTLRRAIRSFERLLPEGIQPTSGKAPEEPKERRGRKKKTGQTPAAAEAGNGDAEARSTEGPESSEEEES